MPYSTNPPAHVIPESRQGRDYYNKYVKAEDLESVMSIAFCKDYQDYGHGLRDSIDENRPHAVEINACSRRRSDGVRDKNWCYRCVAGLPYVALHIYDAERESDRRIDIGL